MKYLTSIVLAMVLLFGTTTVTFSGDKIRGNATNYAGTAGFFGTPGVALPGPLGGRYTGHINGWVIVCGDRCAKLPIIDYCDCYWGEPDQRVVDLNYEAWALVFDDPLSRGKLPVTVEVITKVKTTPRNPAWVSPSLPDTAMSR